MSKPGVLAVVGSGGFLGRALCAHARKANWDLQTFEIDSPLLSEDGLARAANAHAVVWAATVTTPAIAAANPAAVEAEIREVSAAAQAVAELPGSPPFIFISSGGTVYGEATPPFSEDSELRPAGAYGRLKAQLEKDILVAHPGAIIVRISNLYGPGQRPKGGQGVLGYWLDAIARGGRPTVIGSPDTARDYVYIDDGARAVLRVATMGARRADCQRSGEQVRGEVFNIGSGVPTSLAELLELVERAVGHPITADYQPGRCYDVTSTWLDISRATSVLSWSPQVSLAEGIARMWAWCQGELTGELRQGCDE